MEQGVIIASDSRFTLRGNRYDDCSRKVYLIAPNAGCVFAGDVLAAQSALRDIRRYFKRRQVGDPSEQVGRILLQTYEREMAASTRRERALVYSLYFLVGVCSATGEAWITRYSSTSGFKPLHLLGVDAVGWDTDIQAFNSKLHEVQEHRWQDQNVNMDPANWQMDVAISLFWAIEQPGHTATIGGRVQSMVITATGAQEQSFNMVRVGGEPMNEADWEPVTQPLAEAKAYIRRPAAAEVEGEPGLVAAHIIER